MKNVNKLVLKKKKKISTDDNDKSVTFLKDKITQHGSSVNVSNEKIAKIRKTHQMEKTKKNNLCFWSKALQNKQSSIKLLRAYWYFNTP